MFCWIASIAIFGYLGRAPMNQEEPIIKLTPTGNDRPPARGPVRLDQIHKQHYPNHARQGQIAPVTLRVVEEEAKPAKPVELPTSPAPVQRHRAFDGKSQEYNIDEIMRPSSHDPDAIENTWTTQAKNLPAGMVAVICFCVLLSATAIVLLIRRNHHVEDAQKSVKRNVITNVETEVRTAELLVKSIQRTIRQYYLAPTIEEKLRYVRHPEETRAMMEQYYAKHPIESKKCDLITSFTFFTQGDRNFWRVLAIQKNQKREWIFLEQISETEVRIDWETHVHYQPMPWSEYTQKRPLRALDFRISLYPTPYYVGEFVDESRWASYRVTAEGYDEVLFGYVIRNSEEHRIIEAALEKQSPFVIATLMIPSDSKVKHAVVIQKIVSDSYIRADAPKSSSP
jgi:hypothetical protein